MTREGIAAAWSLGIKCGRHPQVAEPSVLEDVRTAFGDGASIADLLPSRSQLEPCSREPAVVVLEMPSKLVSHLRDHEGLGDAERHALFTGWEVRRGKGYTLRIPRHPRLIRHCSRSPTTLADPGLSSAGQKAYQIYQRRV